GPPKRILTVSAARVDRSASQAETVVVIRDITEERYREERSGRQERMSLLGQLAGGIAHDFNNLLSVILNYSEFVASETQASPLRNDVEQIRASARRAAALTSQLLAFSRREVAKPQVLELNGLVAEMDTLL